MKHYKVFELGETLIDRVGGFGSAQGGVIVVVMLQL